MAELAFRRRGEASTQISNGVVGDWRLPDDKFLSSFQALAEAQPCNTLAEKHKMPREERLEFRAESHTYYVDGIRVPRSVTGFLQNFRVEFDPKQAIASLRRNMCSAGKAATPETTMSDAEIEQQWSDNAKVQRARGQLLHFHVEHFLNGFTIAEPHSPEFKQARIICDALAAEGLTAFRTELPMFHVGLQMAGQADLLCKDKHGNYAIVDWKRTKELRWENKFRSLKPPLQHLPDCNYYVYALQLSLYAFILESEYDCQVSRLILGIVHPEAMCARWVEVPPLRQEIALLVEHEISEGRAREAVPGAAATFHAVAL